MRLIDNTALLFALKNAKEVVACFIFTPEQLENNPYRSDHCLQFMIESLEDLEQELQAKGGKLYLFSGTPKKIVSECIKTIGVDAVIVNQDYTPYSIQRDLEIAELCKKEGVSFHSFEDALLQPVEHTLKSDGTPYSIFTPYYRNASKLEVETPKRNAHTNYYCKSIPFAKDRAFYNTILPKRIKEQQGGRSAALAILHKLSSFSEYASERDFPAEDRTTHLSAHLKFTTCSPREVYHAIVKHLGEDSPLIRSLYWRDFFTSIAFHCPWVFTGAFHRKFDKLKWSGDQERFALWCEGKTGFPIVDAGMREMNQTGFMHNRVRMIVASFLVKDMHIDWRWGEKYFAKTLIDYDPSVNNGNWQWAASTGCDAQPYFRIFNPWSQGEKFDPDCIYIKRWIPELDSLSPKQIHAWHKENHTNLYPPYPSPILDHAKESKAALEQYKKIH